MQDIIIRNATIKDIEKIADIKIEGWQTVYRGIVDDDFLDNMDRDKEIEKRRNNRDNGVNIIVAELNNDIMELLKGQGKTKMILGCLKENYPSRAFYEKMGGKVINYDEIEFGNRKYGLAMYEYDITNI